MAAFSPDERRRLEAEAVRQWVTEARQMATETTKFAQTLDAARWRLTPNDLALLALLHISPA